MRRVFLMLWIIGWGMSLQSLWGQSPAAQAVGPRPLEAPLLRIGLIADAQYSDRPAEKDRFYRISLDKLHQAVDTLNARNVDLTVNLGDLIDERLESYPRALQQLDRLKNPVFNVLGNHEFWDIPYHVQNSIYDSLGLHQGYCDYTVAGWRMLFLDGTELAAYSLGAHQDLRLESVACHTSLTGHTNAAIWNGAIGEAQIEWIDWQLSEADAAGEQVLLFCHFPISPAGHPMTLWNEADLRALLHRHKSPVAWIAGHSHEALYNMEGGVHFLTLEGMLATPDSNAFAVLDIFPDRIVVEGYGREPYRVLPLRGATCPADTLLPVPGVAPDAVPPVEVGCLERRVIHWSGECIFSEEVDDDGATYSPRLRPGCYGIWEHAPDGFRFGKVVVLPR